MTICDAVSGGNMGIGGNKKSVVIVDLNAGRRFPTSYWAEWDGFSVKFGGDWETIPPMSAPTEPSKNEVYQYVNVYLAKEDAGECFLHGPWTGKCTQCHK